MQGKEIYINGNLLDLDEANNPIRLTYSVNDLYELANRQAYTTNTFKVPPTQNNKSILGFPDSVNFVQLQPYRINNAKIVQNGIEILTNGVAIITGSSKNISVQILSGIIGFFENLSDKNIRELSWGFNHTWNLSQVGQPENIVGNFIYPIIDYGDLDDSTRTINARQLRPAAFRRAVISKIVSEAGYTMSGEVLSDPKYINSLIPFANDKFEHGKNYSESLLIYKTSARNTNLFTIDLDLLHQTMPLNDYATTNPQGSWNGSIFTAPITARYRVTYKFSMEMRKYFMGGSEPQMYVDIQVNGVTRLNAVLTGSNDLDETVYFYDQVITGDLNINAGQQVKIDLWQHPAVNRQITRIYPGSELLIEVIPEDVVFGSQVQIEAILPDMTQKDFFKDFLQNFGLIVVADDYKKHITFFNMKKLYENKNKAIDITDMLIDDDNEVSYAIDSYGVNNFGKYKDDENVDDLLGQGNLILDNQTLDRNKTIITSKFAATETVIKMGGVAVSQIKKTDDLSTGTPTVTKNFNIRTQPRILLNRQVDGQFTFTDGVNSKTLTRTSVPLFTGLSYQDLFDEYYKEVKQMLFRPFIVKRKIMLKEIDVNKIDWTIPVYDRKTASYYYRNKINYEPNGISEINLIKMP